MTYNPNIPQPTDNLSNSQAQFLANFNQLNVQFAIDHTGFNTGSGNGDGFHKKVTLPGNVAVPSPGAGFGNIYTSTNSSITIPRYKRDNLAVVYSMLPIRAFGVFNGTTGATIGTAMNLSCVRNSTGLYTLTITADALDPASTTLYGVISTSNQTGTNPAIIMTGIPVNVTSAIIGARAHDNTLTDPSSFTVMILQY